MTPKLTIGPIPYHWSADKKQDFYARIADEAPVDTVYLGEVICSKRAPFFDHHYDEVAARLTRAGKAVVFSSLAEVMLKRERKAIEAMAEIAEFEIEINNAAGLLNISGRPHRIGPFLNVYNAETLSYFADRGATHVCLPVELPSASVAAMGQAAAVRAIGVEVQVFGRASLAVSARCYHARAHGRTKDNCQFVCEENPDGMPLTTQDGQSFLRINGIQTMSQSYINLIEELPAMIGMGVTDFRLMPQDIDMVAVAKVFAETLTGLMTPAEAKAQFDALDFDAPFSNGFWHGQAGHRRIAAMGRSVE
ncbi:ubiquinone anaerobic biosynthesis protein UbiV [Sulfitobacter sp. JB4-11]|uniref:ubiquinone anaerobic biosynthesis protein UbiV n=1 Tax=Sulfitobacter rhodophyticola TaxID=3238304 RepID=UPI003D816A3D